MDVMKSYSWSANIAGRKRWLFLPPGEEEKLNKRDDQLPSDSSDVKDLLDSLNVRFYDVVQNPGQVIFVPSGWHHQVWNLVRFKILMIFFILLTFNYCYNLFSGRHDISEPQLVQLVQCLLHLACSV